MADTITVFTTQTNVSMANAATQMNVLLAAEIAASAPQPVELCGYDTAVVYEPVGVTTDYIVGVVTRTQG